jgi:hypothetical protein
MELAEPADTIMCVTVRKEPYGTITIAYKWWGRVVVVCRMVIGRAVVWWILHFTLHNHRLLPAIDALLVITCITCHMGVLKYDIHR